MCIILDKRHILNELKRHLSIKNDADFAHFLGITPTALSNWKARNTIDYELIYTKCDFVDANWLFTGKGEMLRHKSISHEFEQKMMCHTDPVVKYSEMNTVSIPIIDINAAAVGMGNDEYTEILGEIKIPAHMKKHDRQHVIVQVQGESMAPTLLNGSYLIIGLLDKSEWKDMPNEQVYVIGDKNGIGRVKRVRNRWDKGFIVLTSDNIDKNVYNFRNYNLHADEINTIWHVEWYFSTNMDNINQIYYTELNELKNRVEDIETTLGKKTPNAP